MTVYVDDIVVTMPGACESDLRWAERLISHARLTMNARKSRVIHASKEKLVTGVRIYRGEVSAPSGQHLKVKTLHHAIATAPAGQDVGHYIRSLQGHLDHIAQIDPKFLGRAKGHRAKNRKVLVAPR